MKILWWGLQDYGAIEARQHHIAEAVASGQGEQILAGEHPAVITLGRRADRSQILSAAIPVQSTSRGGLATLHSPGQLVIYPILNIKARGWGVREYVCGLLQSTQKSLEQIGIRNQIDVAENPGVFTARGKLAFCGLQIKQGISLHGVSINVNNDLELFRNLVPCGNISQQLDLVANYSAISCEEFFKIWIKNYSRLLEGNLNTSHRGGAILTEARF